MLFYPRGGRWVYLNWALAFRSVGCEVLWLESGRENEGPELANAVAELRSVLTRFDLGDALVLDTAGPLPEGCGALPVQAATDADLLVDLAYTAPDIVRAFRRSVLVDIDPGLTQLWWSDGDLDLGGYDVYFTIGHRVASGLASVPDCGVKWHLTSPCVALDAWPACPPPPEESAWTTVTHWWGEWQAFAGDDFENSKRAGFAPLLELPAHVDAPLELALGTLDDDHERESLERHGWRVVDAQSVASTPEQHRLYVQRSRGEFSAAKPLYVKCATGWLSDRTVCYLASGRPAVVQDTGAADLGTGEGLLTFTDIGDAQAALDRVERNYHEHCRSARKLAEERYAGDAVAGRLLADTLT
jgi:hypothetical protein